MSLTPSKRVAPDTYISLRMAFCMREVSIMMIEYTKESEKQKHALSSRGYLQIGAIELRIVEREKYSCENVA